MIKAKFKKPGGVYKVQTFRTIQELYLITNWICRLIMLLPPISSAVLQLPPWPPKLLS